MRIFLEFRPWGNLPRNWRRWSFHLYQETLSWEGETIYEGHMVSPSGRWVKKVKVSPGYPPDVEVASELEDAEAYCTGCHGSLNLETAVINMKAEAGFRGK